MLSSHNILATVDFEHRAAASTGHRYRSTKQTGLDRTAAPSFDHWVRSFAYRPARAALTTADSSRSKGVPNPYLDHHPPPTPIPHAYRPPTSTRSHGALDEIPSCHPRPRRERVDARATEGQPPDVDSARRRETYVLSPAGRRDRRRGDQCAALTAGVGAARVVHAHLSPVGGSARRGGEGGNIK